MKEKKGLMYKGKFCEVWGGRHPYYSPRFFHGTIPNLSRSLEVGSIAGVVVEYEEDNPD